MGLESIKDPVHFIGIGGAGMSGLAELAVHLGYRVQGSDLKASSMLTRLVELGATVTMHHEAAALGAARSVVFSSAIGDGNVELAEAKKRGLTLLHRSDFLAALMAGKQGVTVAGTHGKSTTSAMITHVLDALGQDPSAAVGGVLRGYGSTARYGKGSLFVAEADESDGSFLKYRPFIGVLTNVALDHMEYFRDQAGLERAFSTYLGHIDPEGTAVIGWDNPLSRQLGGQYAGNRLTYGFVIGSEVRALDYVCSQGHSTFTAMVERDRIPCRIKAMGRHNVQNALCSLAVARALELDVRLAAESLATFAGVDRRMTHVYESESLRIFDDYAHNPGKIAACIAALKEAWPEGELHVVYQAHRYSRLETMYDDMLAALDGADVVHVVPVYSAGEVTTQDFSPARLARDISQRFALRALPCADLKAAVASVERALKDHPGSKPAVILTVGAGDVWQVANELKERL